MANSKKVEIPVNLEKTQLVSNKLGKRKVFLSRLKRKLLKHVWVIRTLMVLGIIALVSCMIFIFGLLIRKTEIPNYFNLVKCFVFTPKGLVEEIEGRTNILILGKGGEGHEAPDLTDTVLFLSLDHRNKKMAIISLPRDIWLPALKTKLNSVYYWGNKKEENGGMILAKASVEEILGQHVHYAVVLDFSGFKKIIDVLGGVEVDVENAFTDEKYPIPGREKDLCGGDTEFKCRYETLRFDQGRQVMDGETALKFARSRNAQGDEGTDFARQKRQQKIIDAVKNKIMDKDILFSPKKLMQLKDAFISSIETDIKEDDGAVLARKLLDSKDNISSFILPEELLINPPKSYQYNNLYVFIPKADNWSEVQNWVLCKLGNGNCLN